MVFFTISWLNPLLASAPANDDCNNAIELDLHDSFATAKISKTVTTSTNQLQIDIQMIPEGVYLIELDNTQGKWTTQFVKG